MLLNFISSHRSLRSKTAFLLAVALPCFTPAIAAQDAEPKREPASPVRTETIQPLHNKTFDREGKTKERKQGGRPRKIAGYLAFDGSTDGNRQVDPQIAVGGGYVLHGTNSGLVIYDKEGHYVRGIRQSGFNGGIDPKMFFDPNNRVFGFNLWNPWDKAKLKPVNVSVSATDDPRGAWNTYPIPAPKGRDGGGIGVSRRWIGYSFPGGPERTFVLPIADAKAGKPVVVHHFSGSLGHPVLTQDPVDPLYFVEVGRRAITVTKVQADAQGRPVAIRTGRVPHGLKHNGHPPQSPQKGTEQRTASGDRNPKNLVLQNGFIWFCQTVRCEGRAAVQWHQIELDGRIVQTGLIHDPKSSYIQSTLAVNQNNDVLVGFQETSETMFISPRLAFRRGSDPKGKMRKIVNLGRGKAATQGVAWGDYSCSVRDGDNGLDLWTIQSIADETGRGDTIIVKVPFPKKAR